MIDTYEISKSMGIEHYLVRRFIDRYINSKKNYHRKNIHYHFRKKTIQNDRGKFIEVYELTHTGYIEVNIALWKLPSIISKNPSGELDI